MRKAYYYLFYRLYKFWELVSVPKFWTDVKTVLSVDILEFFLLLTLDLYYSKFINKNGLFTAGYEIILIGLGIVLFNYLVFINKDQWKEIIFEFDTWPKRKNIIGGIISWSIIIIIVGHFFLLIFLFQ